MNTIEFSKKFGEDREIGKIITTDDRWIYFEDSKGRYKRVSTMDKDKRYTIRYLPSRGVHE